MNKDIPQDMQDVINEVSTTESGRGDLANQYKISDTILDDALADANVDVTITGQPISTNSTIQNTSVPVHTTATSDVNITNTSINTNATIIGQPITSKIVNGFGINAELTPLYELRVANTHRLAGGLFAGSSLDSNFYTSTLTSGATVSVADSVMTVSSNTTNGSTGRVETVTTAQYTASNSNMFRGVIKVGDLGVTGNIRRWGATTTNDGYFFFLNGTVLGIGVRKNTTETLTNQSQFNGDKTFVLDTNFHVYEIYYKTSGIYFIIDGKLIHQISTSTTSLVSSLNLKPAISNVNAASTTNCTISAMLMTIARFGDLVTNPIYKNLVGASTTTLKQSAGRLHSIICNNAAQTAGQSITIYDNTTNSGAKIGTIDLSKLPSPMAIQYNTNGVEFNTGLTLVTVGAAVDITVIYE